jgi:hypothetical protein
MSFNSIPDFQTTPEAVRVFIGSRRADLPEDQFLTTLGATFMPGTPYMLQPLGLAAYLPGVIDGTLDGRLPHEIALIVWPSQMIQRKATRDTLRGRVYTQSHAGVYAPSSGATFPVLLDQFDAVLPGSCYLFSDPVDWRSGTFHMTAAVTGSAGLKGVEFRRAVLQYLGSSREKLVQCGQDQCIVALQDEFLIIWSHYSNSVAGAPFQWNDRPDVLKPLAQVTGVRVICRDEPPAVRLAGTMVLNFIFQPCERFFLK